LTTALPKYGLEHTAHGGSAARARPKLGPGAACGWHLVAEQTSARKWRER